MPEVVVGQPRQYTDRGWPAVASTISIAGKQLKVYYRVSQGPLPETATPFALNALAPAMKRGEALRSATALAPESLAILARAQEFIYLGHHYLHKVAIETPGNDPDQPGATAGDDQRGVGIFFSGGVDSFYSLLQHRDEITHVVFAHGFDTLLENPTVRARNVRAMRQAAAELGKTMIEVETNARTQLDEYEKWSHHTALSLQMAIASVLGLQLTKIYVAENFDSFARWGQDEIRHGLATGGATVFIDGTDRLRIDKTAYIATSETAMRWLRVCWESQAQELNCGHCEKCLRTMVALHLAGALDRCRTFNRPIDIERVRYLRFGQFGHFWPELTLELQRRGDEPALTDAVTHSMGWNTIADNSRNLLIDGLTKRGDHQDILRLFLDYRQRAAKTGPAREQAEQLCRAMTRCFDVQEEIAVMKASRSWQLTAPLRGAGLWLRRLRR